MNIVPNALSRAGDSSGTTAYVSASLPISLAEIACAQNQDPKVLRDAS